MRLVEMAQRWLFVQPLEVAVVGADELAGIRLNGRSS
jgi:hypothetical protein